MEPLLIPSPVDIPTPALSCAKTAPPLAKATVYTQVIELPKTPSLRDATLTEPHPALSGIPLLSKERERF